MKMEIVWKWMIVPIPRSSARLAGIVLVMGLVKIKENIDAKMVLSSTKRWVVYY